MEEGAAAQVATQTAVESAALVVAAVAEQAKETTRAEVAHQGYRNTRVSVTILKRHQAQEAEHIQSFDITDPTFEKEILSELIAYGEEDDTSVDVNHRLSSSPTTTIQKALTSTSKRRRRLSTLAQPKKLERSASVPNYRSRPEQSS